MVLKIKAVGITEETPILVFQFPFELYPVSILYNSSSTLYALHESASHSIFVPHWGCNRQDDRGEDRNRDWKGAKYLSFDETRRESFARVSGFVERIQMRIIRRKLRLRLLE